MVMALVPAGGAAKGAESVSPAKPVSRSQTIAYSTDFETDPEADGWTFVDSDGDGYNWNWSYDHNQKAISGVGIIQSASFESSALTPDNWARSPQITVPNDKQYAYLSFYAIGQDRNFSGEVYRPYVTVNGQDIPLSDDITATRNYWRKVFDISAYAGMTVSFAIRHYNVTDMFMLNVDDFSVFSSDAVCEDEEAPELPHPLPDGCFDGFYFEDDYEMNRIQVFDESGDGYAWYRVINYSLAYEGNTYMASFSCYNGVALTPDNWLVFTGVQIPSGGASVTFRAMGQLEAHPAEHFAAYVIPGSVSSEDDLSRAVEVIAETETVAAWTQYSADLSAFAGQTVSFVIRHFNCTDQSWLLVDQVEFWVESHEYNEFMHGYYFEDPAELDHMTFIDGDGDYETWFIADPSMGYGGDWFVPYEGGHCAASYSFIPDFGPCSPDNSIEFEAVTVPEGGMAVTFWARNNASSYAEVFNAYVKTGGSRITVLANTEPSGEWTKYTVDLYRFAGQEIVFGINHNMSGGHSALLIDQVEFWRAADEPDTLPGDVDGDGVVTMADVTLLSMYLNGENPQITAEGMANADANADGTVDIRDIAAIYAIIAAS